MYSMGFMVDLVEMGVGFGSGAFGHSGLGGMTFAGADPTARWTFAIHVNGAPNRSDSAAVEEDPEWSPVARRRLISRSIIEDLADRS
jgi:hypothetical protein